MNFTKVNGGHFCRRGGGVEWRVPTEINKRPTVNHKYMERNIFNQGPGPTASSGSATAV